MRAASACRAATRKPRHPALCSYYFIISYFYGQPEETLQHPNYHLKAPTTRRRNDNLGTWITVYPGPEISDGANVHGRRLPTSLPVQNNFTIKKIKWTMFSNSVISWEKICDLFEKKNSNFFGKVFVILV